MDGGLIWLVVAFGLVSLVFIGFPTSIDWIARIYNAIGRAYMLPFRLLSGKRRRPSPEPSPWTVYDRCGRPAKVRNFDWYDMRFVTGFRLNNETKCPYGENHKLKQLVGAEVQLVFCDDPTCWWGLDDHWGSYRKPEAAAMERPTAVARMVAPSLTAMYNRPRTPNEEIQLAP